MPQFRRSRLITAVLALALTACVAAPTATPTPAPSPTPTPLPTAEPIPTATQRPAPPALPADADGFTLLDRLGRGVNLGNMLEAPREGDWGLTVQAEYFVLVRAAGFAHVRVPIRWSTHTAAEPPYAIDPEFLTRIDWVVEQALANDLAVVLNVHHYDEIYAEPTVHDERFIAIWTQIAERYQDRPAEVLFELLNEPHDALGAARWNRILAKTLAAVRVTNPTRGVVLGPIEWNSLTRLDDLDLPAGDTHLIATFHYYLPFEFTHQGAEWAAGSEAWLGRTWSGAGLDAADVDTHFDAAAQWATDHQRPLYLGEFGAYSRADLESRVRWTTYVARAAEARGMAWAYWELASGFGVYDPAAAAWRPELLQALIPSPP
ncbi:MAG: glycoside hydrolase family 5 protein [Anaerolineales bacterium]|nr:glycoside hydrolase family 5 protein [Anaerolineales bacterium]